MVSPAHHRFVNYSVHRALQFTDVPSVGDGRRCSTSSRHVAWSIHSSTGMMMVSLAPGYQSKGTTPASRWSNFLRIGYRSHSCLLRRSGRGWPGEGSDSGILSSLPLSSSTSEGDSEAQADPSFPYAIESSLGLYHHCHI